MGNMVFKDWQICLKSAIDSMKILLWFVVACIMPSAQAFEWQFRPNFALNQIADDNLTLSQSNSKGGFVTLFSPGVTMKGQTPNSTANLNYHLLGLYNADDSQVLNVYHQLRMNTTLQAVQNTVFVQAYSTITQQNTTNALLASDIFSGRPALITQTETFNISPYITPHFGQYANGMARFGYTGTYFDNVNNVDQFNNLLVNPITNADTISQQARLTSGTYFNTVNWNLNYFSQDQRNQGTGGNDLHFENYNEFLRYFVNRKFNIYAQSGYENNRFTFDNQSYDFKNGFTYTAGVQIKPSLWYSLQAGFGNNSQVVLQFAPDNNLSALLTYNYKTVGLNLGSSWDAVIKYSTMLSIWALDYHQTTQSVQDNINQQTSLLNEDGTSTAQSFILNLPNFVNDVLTSKTADMSVTLKTGKSLINATLYNTHRHYLTSQEVDDVYGVSANWNWKATPRMTYYLHPLWQNTKSSFNTATNTLYGVTMGVTRSMPIYLGKPLLLYTTLEMRHFDEESTIPGYTYADNRAAANFFVQF